MYRVFSGKEKHQDHSAANAKKQRNTENKKTLDLLAQEDSDKQDKLLEQDQLEQDHLEQKRLKQERTGAPGTGASMAPGFESTGVVCQSHMCCMTVKTKQPKHVAVYFH